MLIGQQLSFNIQWMMNIDLLLA